ncbi:ANTAR domain-containing protein [Aeromicrobium sp. SMF47]|uniref:ANTAR domain-containing protein n=1 Tax=Aeromicrobium yanjiei TaxID=2662028 RepID=A0A5Q2MGA0_9ACTN|nr:MULTISPECIES: GAF and ANTAR domain-containing protein [Aeromicrobium]MRJ75509.1 ANTAR domain-containing protein [Aeromicrobium yanjiei]MRK02468.1 ANTAR domain-containing protein [Aeromicrobium sp. S22]QGG40072.1 ANTAR domain-containing protein [Aeromicrobium yanjiei]
MDSSTFFAQMALDLHDEPNAERTIERIAEYAQVATGCDDAGIMLVHARNQIETAAATSSRVGESHNLQIIHDEGPCLDAIDGEAHYSSSDVARDPRWQKWGPSVAELGIRSVLSVRLETRSRRYGSLNLYAERVDAFDDDDLAVATVFVRHASVALANAHNEEGLQLAIDARKLIGQAQGILMERFDIDADRAFEFLRRQSQTHNVKLRYVAEWVVQHRGSPDATFSGPVPDGVAGR